MKRYLLFFALLGLLIVACQQSPATSNDYGAIGESIAQKNPQLPTKFVDTTGGTYAWMKMYNPIQSLQNRISAPDGYQRMKLPKDSFGEWLRGLPLKAGKPKVLLFNGQEKANQDAQFAVLDIDVGKRDLQQCADAVMRLRAEYLFSRHQHEAIHFNFTNGDNCAWSKWKEGYRPSVGSGKTTWVKKMAASSLHENFRAYMDVVFMYAGTASLEQELQKVGNLREIQIGDVLIHGGFPGHAVLVVDVVENPENGHKMFMLAQSYMPAQEIHILNNFNASGISPWYDAEMADPIDTPEWTFVADELRRFVE